MRSLLTRPVVLRFRLRTLFVVVTAASLWLAWQASQARRQKVAVELVGKYGGNVYYDFNDKNRGARPPAWKAYIASVIGDDFMYSVVGVGLGGIAIDDEAIATIAPHLAGLRHLTWLDIDNVRITDTGLSHLGQINQLERLLVRSQGSPRLTITDEGLGFLGKLTSLTSLVINDAPITGRGLTRLSELRQLVSLNLDYTDVNDDGLQNVGTSHQIKRLRLRGTKISGDGLAHLGGLNGLEELELVGNPIEDSGTRFLPHFQKLQVLSLSGSPITDACLGNLSRVAELRELDLCSTNLTDGGITKLRSLVNLRELRLEDTNVTIEAGRELGAPTKMHY